MHDKKTKKPDTQEIASIKGDDIFFQFIGQVLTNPDAVLSRESRGKGIKLYSDLLCDPHIFSAVQTRVLSVVAREYEVIPASEKRRDVKVAEFVKEVLDGFSYDKACEDLLFGNVKGFSVGEIMWEVSEGSVWISAVKHRSQRRFVFTPEGEARLLTPQALIEGEELPERKFQTVTWGAEAETPYGNPLGNKLYWPWWFKKHGIKWWVVFQEKFAQPTPWGKYPPNTTKEDQDKLLSALDAIQTDSGIITPDNMLIEFLESSRTGKDMYKPFSDQMNSEISKAVLGQTLTSDQGDKGARSLGEVHERIKDAIIEADADLLCAAQNAQMIRWLVDYNFPGVKKYPRVSRRMEEEADLKAQAEVDKILAVDIGLPMSKKYFYETYNLPEPKDGEEVVKVAGIGDRGSAPSPLRGEGRGEGKTAGQKAFAEGKIFTPNQQALESLAERAISGTATALEANEQKILEAVRSAKSYEDAFQRVLEIYPDMEMDALVDMVERVSLNASLFARQTIEEESGG